MVPWSTQGPGLGKRHQKGGTEGMSDQETKGAMGQISEGANERRSEKSRRLTTKNRKPRARSCFYPFRSLDSVFVAGSLSTKSWKLEASGWKHLF